MFSARPVMHRQERAPRYCGVTTLNPCRCCECSNWEKHGCHCSPNNNVTQEDLNQYLAFERRRMARRALDPEWQAVDPIENGHPCIDLGCPPRSLSQCSGRGAVLNCCGEVFDPDHPCCDCCAKALGATAPATAHDSRTYPPGTASLGQSNCRLREIKALASFQRPGTMARAAPYNVRQDAPPCQVYNSMQEARRAYVFKKLPAEESNGSFVCVEGRPLLYCPNKYVPSLDSHVQCLPPQFQGHLRTSGNYMCYIDPTVAEGKHPLDRDLTPEIRSAMVFQNKVKILQADNNRRRTVLHDLEARLREGGDCFEHTRLPMKNKVLQTLTSPTQSLRVDTLGSNKFYLKQEADAKLMSSQAQGPAGIGLGDGTHDCRLYYRRETIPN